MKLRNSKISEVELLTRISTDAFNSDYLVGGKPNDGPADYDNYDWYLLMYKGKNLYSFLVDDKIIGGAVLFKHNNTLEIGRIFIDPSYFKKGYGFSLMQKIEEDNKDINRFILDTPVWNVRTINLYKKCGFRVVSSDGECVSFEKKN